MVLFIPSSRWWGALGCGAVIVFISADIEVFLAEVLWLCSLQPMVRCFGDGAVDVFTPADDAVF